MVQTSAIATGVAIIGMTKSARTKPRNGKFAWKISAAINPKMSGSTTAKKVNQTVCPTDSTKRGSLGSRK
jgi:hypothetical protein